MWVCALSRVQHFATIWTVVHQVPLCMGFSRQEYWSGLPFLTTGDLPDPGIKLASPVSPALAGGFFTTEPPGKWAEIITLNKHLLPARGVSCSHHTIPTDQPLLCWELDAGWAGLPELSSHPQPGSGVTGWSWHGHGSCRLSSPQPHLRHRRWHAHVIQPCYSQIYWLLIDPKFTNLSIQCHYLAFINALRANNYSTEDTSLTSVRYFQAPYWKNFRVFLDKYRQIHCLSEAYFKNTLLTLRGQILEARSSSCWGSALHP